MSDGPFDRAIYRDEALLHLTAEIAVAHVAHNNVAAGDVAALITNIHGALAALGQPFVEPAAKLVGRVTERASIKPDGLISMIDGKPYKMLRRHIGLHGYTPESYREAFGLSPSYPMVATAYSEQRRQLAKSIGLGTPANRTR